MAVMAVWAAALITYGVSTGIAMDSAEPGLNYVLKLDMALDSVDDMYTGCKDKMAYRVKNEYLPNEMKNKDPNFAMAWRKAEDKYKTSNMDIWKKMKHELSTVQKMAIYAYTLGAPKLYLGFNNAVRTQQRQYKTTFSYHTLHFLLTDALQTLIARNPEAERCLTGYRRVNSSFNSRNVLNKEIRFGSSTSSSMGRYPSPKIYGEKSCFQIFTCFGADISLYSQLREREILIPPYEVFKVIKIQKRSDMKNLPCEVVYKLKSTRKPKSSTNCALFLK